MKENTICYLADGLCLSKEVILRIVIVGLFIQQPPINNSQEYILVSHGTPEKKGPAMVWQLTSTKGPGKKLLNSYFSDILEYCPYPPRPGWFAPHTHSQ